MTAENVMSHMHKAVYRIFVPEFVGLGFVLLFFSPGFRQGWSRVKTLHPPCTCQYREGICQGTFDHRILFMSWMKDKMDLVLSGMILPPPRHMLVYHCSEEAQWATLNI